MKVIKVLRIIDLILLAIEVVCLVLAIALRLHPYTVIICICCFGVVAASNIFVWILSRIVAK